MKQKKQQKNKKKKQKTKKMRGPWSQRKLEIPHIFDC